MHCMQGLLILSSWLTLCFLFSGGVRLPYRGYLGMSAAQRVWFLDSFSLKERMSYTLACHWVFCLPGIIFSASTFSWHT